MDARNVLVRTALVRTGLVALALSSLGASYRTQNFVINAPTQQAAEQIGKHAEKYRHDLAVLWLGKPLPNWQQPCPITAQVGETMGAGGATSFVFDQGQVFGWTMNIQGSLERILDSVLPHEVTHTVFADHFRRPLPRWADEGACTTVEHVSERTKQQQMLISFLRTGRGIPFQSMFAMKEYPRDVLPLYAQGHSLASYLIQQGGRHKYLNFVGAGMSTEQWGKALQQFYGVNSLAALQDKWLAWVKDGSPAIQQPTPDQKTPDNTLLASTGRRPRPEPNLIYRGQSADPQVAGATAAEPPVAANAQSKASANALAVADARNPNGANTAAPAFEHGLVPVAPVAVSEAMPVLPGPGDTLASAPRPGPDAWNAPAARSATHVSSGTPRPQPGEPASQVILEWDQGVASNPSAPKARSVPMSSPGPGQSVYGARTAQGPAGR
jgi:hypothetical protein